MELNRLLTIDFPNRWCRKPGICGRDVIRESAYCYVEGSFCQKWIHRRIRGSHEDDNDGNKSPERYKIRCFGCVASVDVDIIDIKGIFSFIRTDSILDEFELNPDTVESFGASRNDDTWKCGTAANAKNSRLSYLTRIIGGKPALPGSWPWQVAVLNRFRVSTLCGPLYNHHHHQGYG